MTSGAEPLSLVAAVTHARQVGADERERFASEIRQRWGATGLLLETCHRVEWYGSRDDDLTPLAAAIPAGGELLAGVAAAHHAIAVAVGLDSVVIGEDQLLHQLRASVAGARHDRRLDPVLDRLLTQALRAGRRARSWRQGPPRSLADVALAATERRIGPLRGRRVLVVGAGRMARLTVDAALATGATVSVTSRTSTHAGTLARLTGAEVTPFDPGPTLGGAAAILVALRGPWPIARATADALVATSAVLVDISVPPAVPPVLSARLGTRFVSADDLASAEVDVADGTVDLARLRRLVEATLAEFRVWHDGRGRRAVARALADRVEKERRTELDELWRRLSPLAPDDREAIERMSRHLAERLLREPLERLGSDPDGRHERAVRDLFSL